MLWDARLALETPLPRIEENIEALGAFARSDQLRQLATAFKRVRNIAREFDGTGGDEDLRAVLTEPAELALLAEIERHEAGIGSAGERERGFAAAYAAAAGFAPVVARFFEEVFVMSDDVRLRQARLRLMKRLERLILTLGDISEIVAVES